MSPSSRHPAWHHSSRLEAVGANSEEEQAMRFQATVEFDFKASSLAEAGERLNELLEHAKTIGEMEVASVQLGTPAKAEPVTLPAPVPGPERAPAPPPAPTPPRYSPPMARAIPSA
jgi:hypothetical protein